MATVSERARQAGKLAYWKAFEYAERPDNGVLEIADLIEQALLAERRLARIDAFEESAKIARRYQTAVAPTTNAAEKIEYLILERAAAEKEVGK